MNLPKTRCIARPECKQQQLNLYMKEYQKRHGRRPKKIS